MTAKYWNGFFLELLVTKVKDTQVDRSFWACLQEKNDWVKIKKRNFMILRGECFQLQ